ncbi:carbohydrate ABC transporter permease [Curtobacterium sp. ER1/6]|uniref:carbohydrate ABC transporter permease n=1 Tax=Curtobacterium sp. ER1/6 TaxID=1891920 RepID=UPI000AC341F7|nr:carbohydrate ABC transporter permease [Curtobacterium sp. ER1/6]
MTTAMPTGVPVEADVPTAVPTPEGIAATKRIRRRRRPVRWISNTIAVVFCLVWIFPVYWMVNTAFKPRSEALTSTPLFAPAHPTIENFVTAFTRADFLVYLGNSTIVVVGAVVLSLALGILASAALSRFRFRGRRPILVAILLVQMLPGTALLIPQFLIFNQVGLTGTYAGLILAYVAAVLPFSIWVMRGFFLAIPMEVEEAARIDGASTWQVLTKVLFPLVMPGMIATSVFAFIAAWNDYIVAYTFMQDQAQYTLPVWLASFTTQTTGTDFTGQMAASVLFSLPVVVFFMIVQRNLVSGMSAGAVKG